MQNTTENLVVLLTKGIDSELSSVALTIGLLELTGRARAMQEFSFKVFEAFTAATVIYLVVNLVIVMLMRVLERKMRVPGFIGSATPVTPGH